MPLAQDVCARAGRASQPGHERRGVFGQGWRRAGTAEFSDPHNEFLIADFKHIVRKTQDPSEWVKNGLRILSEWHYQKDDDFSQQLTALFSLDSAVAEALLEAGQCRLHFKQDSIEHKFDFDVVQLGEDEQAFQVSYWHNHLFNPTLPGKVQVLGFKPRLSDA